MKETEEIEDKTEEIKDKTEEIKDKTEEIKLPTLGVGNKEELISTDISEELKKGTVGTVLLKEESSVFTPSYLLDMTDVGDIMPSTLDAIQTMIYKEGDTAVYMKNGEHIGIIGYGDGHELYSMLETFVSNVYSGRCKIYKNNGDSFRRLKNTDVGSIILDI